MYPVGRARASGHHTDAGRVHLKPLTHELSEDRSRGEGEVLDATAADQRKRRESSGGETRTLNLAVAPDQHSDQHQLE